MPSAARRCAGSAGGGVRADRAFVLVLGLGAVSGAVLGGLLAVLVPRTAQVLATGPDDLVDTVTLALLALATAGIALGLGSLFRQLLATASLIRGLVARRVAAPARVRAVTRSLDIASRVDVVSDARAFAFCYWFRRPRICVSTGLVRALSNEELRAVLAHERYHLRQRDPLRVVIARYFAAALYVVPVVDELTSLYALQKEIAADDAAVREAGVAPLARALYKVLPTAPGDLGLLAPVSGLSITEARIDRLTRGLDVPLRLSPGSVALSAGALAAAAVLAAIRVGTSGTYTSLPPLLAVPALLLAPASLLFAAALAGGAHQVRAVAGLATRR